MPLDDDIIRSLKSAAKAASKNAYAPHSGFPVGAAILSADGHIFSGCNVENASYGLTICAERAAICQMIASGDQKLRAVLVYTPTQTPTPPCGACRQVISEIGPQAEIYCVCDSSITLHQTIASLLPSSFGKNPDRIPLADRSTLNEKETP